MICNAVQPISRRCHCIRNKKKKLGKDLYHKIAQSHFEVCNECCLWGVYSRSTLHLQDLKGHECVATLTAIVWFDYAVVQRFVSSILACFYLSYSNALSTPSNVQHSSYTTSTLLGNFDNLSGFSCKNQRCQYI